MNLYGYKASHYILILAFIFLSASPLLEGISKALIMFFVFFYLAIGSKFMVSVKDFKAILYVGVVFFLTLLIDIYYASIYGINSLSLFYFFGSFVIGFLLTKRLGASCFMDKYEYVMRFLALLSLFFYFGLIMKPGLITYLWDYSYYNTNHKTVIVYNHVQNTRNSGFASEPGLYQFFLCLALWWRLYKAPKFDSISMIYIITLLTTKSTAGFFSLFFLLLPYIKFRNLIIIIPFSLLAYGVIIDDFFYHLDNKLWGSNAFDGRLNPAVNSLILFLENPFGLGTIRYTEYLSAYKIGSFDAFTQAAIRFGFLGLFLVFVFIGYFGRTSVVLAAIFVITCTSQNVWLSPLVIAIFYYSLNSSFDGFRKDLGKIN